MGGSPEVGGKVPRKEVELRHGFPLPAGSHWFVSFLSYTQRRLVARRTKEEGRQGKISLPELEEFDDKEGREEEE